MEMMIVSSFFNLCMITSTFRELSKQVVNRVLGLLIEVNLVIARCVTY